MNKPAKAIDLWENDHRILQIWVRPHTTSQQIARRGMIILRTDEKSQIQALDRTQPGLPLKKGRCGTMTHDYERNGAAALFAALNILDGKVLTQY